MSTKHIIWFSSFFSVKFDILDRFIWKKSKRGKLSSLIPYIDGIAFIIFIILFFYSLLIRSFLDLSSELESFSKEKILELSSDKSINRISLILKAVLFCKSELYGLVSEEVNFPASFLFLSCIFLFVSCPIPRCK